MRSSARARIGGETGGIFLGITLGLIRWAQAATVHRARTDQNARFIWPPGSRVKAAAVRSDRAIQVDTPRSGPYFSGRACRPEPCSGIVPVLVTRFRLQGATLWARLLPRMTRPRVGNPPA